MRHVEQNYWCPSFYSGVIGLLLCSTEGPEVNFRQPVNSIENEDIGFGTSIHSCPLKFYNSEVCVSWYNLVARIKVNVYALAKNKKRKGLNCHWFVVIADAYCRTLSTAICPHVNRSTIGQNNTTILALSFALCSAWAHRFIILSIWIQWSESPPFLCHLSMIIIIQSNFYSYCMHDWCLGLSECYCCYFIE